MGRRGPDFQCHHTDNETIFSYAAVLWHQGEKLFPQPVIKEGLTFLWNGDLFGVAKQPPISDTEFVFNAILQNCNSKLDLVKTFENLTGPWSFVLYDASNHQIWFGRDILGRHTLLLSQSESYFVISSVAISSLCVEGHSNISSFDEVPAVGIYCYDVLSCITTLYHWDSTISSHFNPLVEVSSISLKCSVNLSINDTVPSTDDLKMFDKAMTLEDLLSNSCLQGYVGKLKDKLRQAVQIRIDSTCSYCQMCCKHVHHGVNSKCSHPKIGVLFSGGIDSTVLAYFLHECLPLVEPIDLINVAFSGDGDFMTPDRITGLAALQDLESMCQGRVFNFVKVNVAKDELQEMRQKRISHLLQPCHSVLDDSIGSALWFAARGLGHLHGQSYISPARVLLLGMGADEQLAGYSRHRHTFHHYGWAALTKELETELRRISSRNLGRDNRIIGDHGREGRYPFLDEEVITYLNSVPIWVKSNMNFPRGMGEKLLLRLAARSLGLISTSDFPKRAIQFGSRIAKLENRKEKGSDSCERLQCS